MSVNTELTGSLRIRAENVGLIKRSIKLILQVEESQIGKIDRGTTSPDIVEINEKNWRDANVEDLLYLKMNEEFINA